MKTINRQMLALLALPILVAACAHHVDPRPNTPVGSDVAEQLVLVNDTATPLTVVPALPGNAGLPITVQPTEQKQFDLMFRLEQNQSPGREQEVVLVPEKSSPYVTQSGIDALFKARFGSGPAREIRVRLGKCLFDSGSSEHRHELHLTKPPLSGVPALRFCP